MIYIKAILAIILFILPANCGATETATNLASESLILRFSEPLPASFTADQLFDRMEKSSERINAITAEVELVDIAGSSTAVTLRVKGPDKFSITMSDGSSSIYFNGNKLWIYIKPLNECFYHYSEPTPWWNRMGSLVSLFEPKKIFMDMTRKTLNTIFDIFAIKREELPDKDFYYHLKLTPKYKDVFARIFELGHYEAVFSEKTYLPAIVREFDTEGKLKNQLFVKSYKMNDEVADGLFEFKNESSAVMMPISIVIMQKIEDFKDKIVEEVQKAREAMTKSFLNWSF